MDQKQIGIFLNLNSSSYKKKMQDNKTDRLYIFIDFINDLTINRYTTLSDNDFWLIPPISKVDIQKIQDNQLKLAGLDYDTITTTSNYLSKYKNTIEEIKNEEANNIKRTIFSNEMKKVM